MALEAEDPELSALCFDPVPSVIHRVLENPRTGLPQARLILLCARSLVSMLLVENLARWPATPPTLIAHLLKQPMVRQASNLKLLLQQHPNRPRSAP